MIRNVETRAIAYGPSTKDAFTYHTCAILRHRGPFREEPGAPPG